jgi:hypothetical protein
VAVVTWDVPADAPEGTTASVEYFWSPSDFVLPRYATSDVPGRAEIPLADEGRYTSFRVALVRPDGTVGPRVEAAGELRVDRTAPSAPVDVRQVGGTIDWTTPAESGAPIVRAHWRYCRGWNVGGDLPCAEGSTTEHPFVLARDVVPMGASPAACTGNAEYLSLWLEDAAGNVSRQNAGGFGSSMTPSCVSPLPAPTTLRPTPLALEGRAVAVRGRPGRHRVTVTATVPRGAAGRVALRVTRRGAGPRFTRTVTAQVRGGKARAAFVVPRGVRRLAVRATFAATATHAAAKRTATLRVGR